MTLGRVGEGAGERRADVCGVCQLEYIRFISNPSIFAPPPFLPPLSGFLFPALPKWFTTARPLTHAPRPSHTNSGRGGGKAGRMRAVFASWNTFDSHYTLPDLPPLPSSPFSPASFSPPSPSGSSLFAHFETPALRHRWTATCRRWIWNWRKGNYLILSMASSSPHWLQFRTSPSEGLLVILCESFPPCFP